MVIFLGIGKNSMGVSFSLEVDLFAMQLLGRTKKLSMPLMLDGHISFFFGKVGEVYLSNILTLGVLFYGGAAVFLSVWGLATVGTVGLLVDAFLSLCSLKV